MGEITTNSILIWGALAAGIIITLQLVLTFSMLFSLRSAQKERNQIHREMYGLVKKLEGLTASRREQMVKQYDAILDVLTTRLPPAVAAQTSQAIFETESKILSRLAELEPNLKDDAVGKKKMDELIKSMESLEKTIVALAADTVRNVMVEGRRVFFDDERDFESKVM